MREFELDRPVDAVGVMAGNSKNGEVGPTAVYVPLVVVPVAVYAYALVANQVYATIAYWTALGISTYKYVNK